MGNRLITLLFLIVSTLMIVVISHQAFNKVNKQYDIEVAQEYSSADTVTFKGVFIRDEEVIDQSYSGVLSYSVTDGGKVAKDSVVAYVYNSENEIEINRRIETYENEIELLNAAQNPGTVQTAQPDFISSLISEEYQTITAMLAKGEIADLKSHRDNLFTLMCIYQIAIGREENYDERIAELSAREAQLRRQKRDFRQAFYSPDSGYFVSYTDGFEDQLSFDKALDITKAQIEGVIAHDTGKKGDSIGKLIKGYDWKIAGVIDNSSNTFNAGDVVHLSFASVADTVEATIEKLDDAEDGQGVIVVLRCDELTYNLVKMRSDRVDMTLHDFEGIRVPREALRFNKHNEKGCYVLWGQRVLFKKIDEIYESEDYILSRITSDERYVCVYDNIIKSGVDTAAYYANYEEPEEEPPEAEEKIPEADDSSGDKADNKDGKDKGGKDKGGKDKDGKDSTGSEEDADDDEDSDSKGSGEGGEEEPDGDGGDDDGDTGGEENAGSDEQGDVHFE